MEKLILNEKAGVLKGLPLHWIKYLAERYGKGYGSDQAGEKSIVTPLKRFDGGHVKTALQDKNNLAVIGRIDGEPLFMIAQHHKYQTKFRIFEIEKSRGDYDSKGESFYRGRRPLRVIQDAYTMGQLIDIVDQMYSQYPDGDLTIEAISKDPERESKIKTRREQKSLTDPLYREKNQWGDPNLNVAQRERGEKWAEKKRPILDAKMDAEVKKMKDKINTVLDDALDKAIIDVKRGYSYSFDKTTLGKSILAQVDLSPILNLGKGYAALKGEYRSDPIHVRARQLKQSGLIP